MASSTQRKLSNEEVVTVAVFLLGGTVRSVGTEDVAIKAHEIAPGRFTWKKYKDRINLEAVRKRLWDAKSDKKGRVLVEGSDKDGWVLTPTGREFAEQYVELSRSALPQTSSPTLRERQWASRERSRLLDTDAYKKIAAGRSSEVTVREANAFFRLDEYISGPRRERNIARIEMTFGGDKLLGPVTKDLAARVRESAR